MTLKLDSITHKYRQRPTLTGVSLKIDRAAFLCLLGPSGSGKTTLLKIIAGLLTQTSGNVYIDTVDQSSVPTYRRNIGFVFQSPVALFPHLSVFDNISFAFTSGRRKLPGGSDWKQAVFEMLSAIRLERYAGIASLSGGQKQRVAVARALVYKPSLLLLDEPLSSLDNRAKNDLLELMKNLHSKYNTTFVYVTRKRSTQDRNSHRCS